MNLNNLFKVLFTVVILTVIMFGCQQTDPAASVSELDADGIRFTLNDQPFDMWGIRVGSAAIEEEYTSHLIDQLDEYMAHGVNTLAVYYMGTHAGYANSFPSPDGTVLDQDHHRRMVQIIEEAASEPGLSVFMHNNSWMQGPGEGHPLRYDLAGYGTEEDPGIRWYFEAVREARELN